MQRLSPIRDLANTQGINMSSGAQNALKKYAVNTSESTQQSNAAKFDSGSDEDEMMDVSKFDSKKKMQDEKNKRKQEIEELMKIGADLDMVAEATRQPNKISKMTVDPITGTAK